VAFIVEVLLNQRGYQDSWILQDIFVPTILYILTFSVVVVLVDNNKLIALVCASFLIVLNAIPNLKYQLFYGTFDSAAHYGYITSLISLGHVPSTGFYATQYQDFPGMHIFIGSLSNILGVSVNVAIKVTTSTIVGIIPLMVYLVTNRAFEPRIQRFIIVASGLPTFMTYDLVGSTFGVILYFCVACLILRGLLAKNKRPYTVVLLVFVFGLLFSHAVSTLYLISFLVIAIVLLKFLSMKQKWVLKSYSNARIMVTGTLLILTVSFLARLTFESGKVLELFTSAGEIILIRQPSGTLVPGTFFRVPFSAEVIFLVLNYIQDAALALMGFIGIVVLYVKLRRKNREIYEKFYPFLMCFLAAILALLAFQFLSGFSGIEFGRFIDYAAVLTPFFVGLFLWYLNQYSRRYKFGSILVFLVLFSCLSVSLIQIFPCQPIAPRANVLSSTLPANEYIYDFREVNTVYQESMILFAENFSSNNTLVAADTVTEWQTYGFANDTFFNRVIYYSPLETPNLPWELFLLHYDGKAGPLNEHVQNRTSEIITNLKNSLGNVVYDNGQSFIIER
jgi:hypothetical protein